MKTSKIILKTLILLAFLGSASAAPDEPYRLFGAITDSEDNPVEVEVQIEYDGSVIKGFDTDSNGQYDIMIPNGKYEDESLEILVDGEQKTSFIFEPLGVSEENFQHENEEDNQKEENPSSSTGGGGGGGGLPSQDQKSEGKTENKEETRQEVQEEKTEKKEGKEIVEVNKEIEDVEKGEKVVVDLSQQIGNPQTDNNKNGGSGSNGESSDESTSSTVTSISFSSSTNQESGEITVKQAEAQNAEQITENITEKPEGETITYTEVETDTEAENATFKFEVKKQELENMNATPEEIVQERYNGTDWNELETEYKEKLNGSYKFQAYSPEGFSLFAITIEEQKSDKPRKNTQTLRTLIKGLFIGVVLTLTVLAFSKREYLIKSIEKSINHYR